MALVGENESTRAARGMHQQTPQVEFEESKHSSPGEAGNVMAGRKGKGDMLSDPMLQKIKALSRIETSASENGNTFMERTRVAEAKFQSLLLPEEWLEMSDAYLRLPPTLSDPSFISILQVAPSSPLAYTASLAGAGRVPLEADPTVLVPSELSKMTSHCYCTNSIRMTRLADGRPPWRESRGGTGRWPFSGASCNRHRRSGGSLCASSTPSRPFE
jgi:hypothetical protein